MYIALYICVFLREYKYISISSTKYYQNRNICMYNGRYHCVDYYTREGREGQKKPYESPV